MAIIGRVLEGLGFRVGIIAQPDWRSTQDFEALGAPRLFFGVTGGNMDSMVNRYTSDRRVRSDDAYTPGGQGGKRPDRCVIVYSQRIRESFKSVPIVIGGIEASLRRIAHFDYWAEQVRRSVLVDSKADLLVFGNAERQIGAIAQRLDAGRGLERHHRCARYGFSAARHAGRMGGNRLERVGYSGSVESARRSLRRRGAAPDGCDRAGRRVGCATRRPAAGAALRRPRPRPRPGNPPRRPKKSLKFFRKVPNALRRAQRHSPAVLRAGQPGPRAVRACVAHFASRSEPRKRARAGAAARQPGTVAESSAHSARRTRHGRHLRVAVCAAPASRVRHGENPRVIT